MLHAPLPHPLVDDAEQSLVDRNTGLTPGDAEPPPRQCGRCRLMFAGDPTLYYPPGRPAWWLCPPCRASLLGRHPHPTGVAHRRRPPRRIGDTS
jgi:hypothetical protein